MSDISLHIISDILSKIYLTFYLTISQMTFCDDVLWGCFVMIFCVCEDVWRWYFVMILLVMSLWWCDVMIFCDDVAIMLCDHVLRSRGAHCDRKPAVEVQRCPLRSEACGWGPAVPTAIWSLRLRSRGAHCDLKLAKRKRRRTRTRTRWRWRSRALRKSNNPHLRGGESFMPATWKKTTEACPFCPRTWTLGGKEQLRPQAWHHHKPKTKHFSTTPNGTLGFLLQGQTSHKP